MQDARDDYYSKHMQREPTDLSDCVSDYSDNFTVIDALNAGVWTLSPSFQFQAAPPSALFQIPMPTDSDKYEITYRSK